GRNLIQSQRLAFRLVDEVLGIGVHRGDPRIRLPGPGLIAGDEAVDGGLALACHRADDVLPRPALRLEPGQVAGEITDLLLAKEETEDVLGLAGEILVRDVYDCEARLRETLRDRAHGADLGVADSDDQVVAAARERGKVRDVVGRRL